MIKIIAMLTTVLSLYETGTEDSIKMVKCVRLHQQNMNKGSWSPQHFMLIVLSKLLYLLLACYVPLLHFPSEVPLCVLVSY